MTKKELEKAIKNGESVWVVFNEYSYKNDSIKEIDWMKVEGVELHDNYLQYFNGENLRGHYYELIFKTKAEAEHYLHHANVTRTDTLPFLTWEEFREKRCFYFTNYSDYCGMDTVNKQFSLELNVSRDKIILFSYEAIPLEEWEATEANFYKAYDECVRLFKGE